MTVWLGRRRDFIRFGAALTLARESSAAGTRTLLVVGDSLSAEYGLARGSGWVALLDARLQQRHAGWTVVNASISGDTSSGGRVRLASLLQQHRPATVVIELGANDALRGLPLAMTEGNLSAMVDMVRAAGAKVLLIGIQVPPNYGADYQRKFAAMFAQVAQQHKTALVPFLLKGVADDPDATKWFQADRIHPVAAAHPRILENVWPVLEPLLKP